MATPKIDAVLPLRRHDYERFLILDRSLKRHFRDLGVCWVVTKDPEHAELRGLVKGEAYRVIPESSIIPEIAEYRILYRVLYSTGLGRLLRGRLNVAGWFVQQLVKLAITPNIDTDFFITLDSDVICMKPVAYDDLIQDARAITNTGTRDVHSDWYTNTERVLGMRRSGITHGVTPAVLCREAVMQLQGFLATRVSHPVATLAKLCPRGSHLRSLLSSWRSHLLRNTPWTEYSLYYTFLEATGTFDRFHVRRGPQAIYDNDRSVWFERDFRNVDVEAVMRGEAFFWVVQSNAQIAPDKVWEKVRDYIE